MTAQIAQFLAQPLAIGQDIVIGLRQVATARRDGCVHLDAGRLFHRAPQAGRQDPRADLAGLGLNQNRAGRIHLQQRLRQSAFKALLAGLWLRHPSQQRAAMIGQGLQINHLPAHGPHPLQQLGLGAAGIAVQRHQVKRQLLIVKIGMHQPPVALIAALDQASPPADLAQHPGETARALAAAPAIDQGPPAALMVAEAGFNIVGGIAKHQRRAQFARLKGAVLHIDGADFGPFFVVQNRQIDGAGDVVFGIFGRAAHIYDGVVAMGHQVMQGFIAIGHRVCLLCASAE
jgi:hypothetical protein